VIERLMIGHDNDAFGFGRALLRIYVLNLATVVMRHCPLPSRLLGSRKLLIGYGQPALPEACGVCV
jgi:hypothetical protein